MKLKDYDYIYLHGFASSPTSSKAQFYRNKFIDYDVDIKIPDLNGEDFGSLTLSRQLLQVKNIIDKCTNEIILIGSSMGGLTSYILAEEISRVVKVIALAPAFNMLKLWEDAITKEELILWKKDGYKLVYHYGYGKDIPLSYDFYTDLRTHNCTYFRRRLPCVIFHGIYDNVVPISLSTEYSKSNPYARLVCLEDDHSVNKFLDKMWNLSLEFICNE